MDCCICGPMAAIYRPPRNTICSPCYEGAKAIIAFLNADEHTTGDGGSSDGFRGLIKHTNSSTKARALTLLILMVSNVARQLYIQ
jgi:speckle-type POZ protein